MAQIFSESFTDGDGTLLDAHTPDVGDSWTKLINTGTGDLAISGNALAANTAGYGASEGGLYTADVSYPSADYEAQTTVVTSDSADDTFILAVRIQDSNNMYALRYSIDVFELYKRSGGTWSVIGTDLGAVAALEGIVIKLQAVGSTIKTFVEGVEQHSVSDSTHSAAGKAGIGFGAVMVATDDCSTGVVDDFEVNTVASAPATAIKDVIGVGVVPFLR